MNNPEGGAPFNDPGSQKPDSGSSPRQGSVSEQWNNLLQDERVQQAKQVSRQYFRFFASALARPYGTMKSVGTSQVQHGIITLSLIALLSSLYFLTLFLKWGLSPALGPGFLKPLLLTVLGLAVAFGLSFAVLRLEKMSFDPRVLFARFGTLLVPSVATLLLAILFLVCGLNSFSMYLMIFSYLFVFVAMNTVLFQYPLNTSAGPIDIFFTIFIANAATGYVFSKLIVSVIAGVIGGFFGGISPLRF
jgi:hypothetical protein